MCVLVGGSIVSARPRLIFDQCLILSPQSIVADKRTCKIFCFYFAAIEIPDLDEYSDCTFEQRQKTSFCNPHVVHHMYCLVSYITIYINTNSLEETMSQILDEGVSFLI